MIDLCWYQAGWMCSEDERMLDSLILTEVSVLAVWEEETFKTSRKSSGDESFVDIQDLLCMHNIKKVNDTVTVTVLS